jgi:2-amino-4-hydroxy-6-hydroxymethyldihydropteridine diphosphokinase
MNGIFLGIGGNMGNRKKLLHTTRGLIEVEIGAISKSSSVFKTKAWGLENQADFYNQVLYVRTKLSAVDCLKKCLSIEKKMGRERTTKWSSRTIDIDILFFNNEIIKKKDLKIPHPHLHERNFVLVPMNEIAPHYIHPFFKQKIFTLLKNSSDKLSVKKVV